MNDLPIETIAKHLAVEMTARTGELWRAVITEERHPQIMSQGACLNLSEDWRTHRLRIHATAPHDIRERTTGETITADPKRSYEAIARDIENRILAHAREHLAESRQYDEQRRQEEAAAHLRKSIMQQFAEEEYNGKLHKSSKDHNRQMWIEITNYNNSATIQIHLPFADALKLVKHIQKGEYIK